MKEEVQERKRRPLLRLSARSPCLEREGASRYVQNPQDSLKQCRVEDFKGIRRKLVDIVVLIEVIAHFLRLRRC